MNVKPIYFFLLCFFFSGFQKSWSQSHVTNPADTTKTIEILNAKKLQFLKPNDTTELQILTGDVKLRQEKTLFYCDSCVINNITHIFEAFGHVHINDADTANAYSDYLRYLTDKRIAYLQKNVSLTDGNATLTTDNLEYDVDTKLGIYTQGGKVVNKKKSVLTSTEGYYYTDLKDIYFKKNVELKDPAYTLRSDSLLYNTESEVARFIAKTFIRDSTGRTIVTSEGFYDTKSKKAEFGKRPVIQDGARRYTGDAIITNDSTHISQINGNAIIVDTAQQTTIIAGHIIANNNTESFLAFNKPLMIVKQDNDSIYITADTLFSAKLTDLFTDSVKKDTIKTVKTIDTKNKDSTNRYFQAFYHVRIFSDSVQSVCDSMFYSFKDSVFRLYKDPVVWSKASQVTGDTILLFTKNRKADRIKVFENSLMVNKVQGDFFNQIKSLRMDGYLTDGSLDSIRARGFAECVYYIQNEDSSFTGVNQSSSDVIDVYFSPDSTGNQKQLEKVVFRSAVKGTLWPMHSKKPEELQLKNFKWLEVRRPKTKFDLFQ